jgi:hypothetical protein
MSTIDNILNYTAILLCGASFLWITLRSGTKHRVLASFALFIILLSLARLVFMYWGMGGIAHGFDIAAAAMVVITGIGMLGVKNPRAENSANGKNNQN